MNALIVGGGLVGSELAHMLAEAGITMSIIEQSEERCDLIEPGLNELGVRVFCGDGDGAVAFSGAGQAHGAFVFGELKVVAAVGDVGGEGPDTEFAEGEVGEAEAEEVDATGGRAIGFGEEGEFGVGVGVGADFGESEAPTQSAETVGPDIDGDLLVVAGEFCGDFSGGQAFEATLFAGGVVGAEEDA